MISEGFFNLSFISSIYILFFFTKGYTFSDIGLFEMVTSLTIILTDLPSGVLADLVGRKKLIIFANLCLIIMLIILIFNKGGLLILIIAGILNGLEFSSKSGSKSALLYDILLAEGEESNFLKISGKINAISLASSMIGAIIGALLFQISPNLPNLLWIGSITISISALFFVQEAHISSQLPSKREFLQKMWNGVQYIFKYPRLLWFVIFFGIADYFAESYWDILSQVQLNNLGLASKWFGLLFAGYAAMISLFSLYVDKIERMFKQKSLLLLIILIQILCYVSMAFVQSWELLIFIILVLRLNRNLVNLLSNNYTNQLIPSEIRASVLSAASFLRNSIFGGSLVIFTYGIVLDKWGEELTLLGSAFILALFGFVMIIIFFTSHKMGEKSSGNTN